MAHFTLTPKTQQSPTDTRSKKSDTFDFTTFKKESAAILAATAPVGSVHHKHALQTVSNSRGTARNTKDHLYVESNKASDSPASATSSTSEVAEPAGPPPEIVSSPSLARYQGASPVCVSSTLPASPLNTLHTDVWNITEEKAEAITLQFFPSWANTLMSINEPQPTDNLVAIDTKQVQEVQAVFSNLLDRERILIFGDPTYTPQLLAIKKQRLMLTSMLINMTKELA